MQDIIFKGLIKMVDDMKWLDGLIYFGFIFVY